MNEKSSLVLTSFFLCSLVLFASCTSTTSTSRPLIHTVSSYSNSKLVLIDPVIQIENINPLAKEDETNPHYEENIKKYVNSSLHEYVVKMCPTALHTSWDNIGQDSEDQLKYMKAEYLSSSVTTNLSLQNDLQHILLEQDMDYVVLSYVNISYDFDRKEHFEQIEREKQNKEALTTFIIVLGIITLGIMLFAIANNNSNSSSSEDRSSNTRTDYYDNSCPYNTVSPLFIIDPLTTVITETSEITFEEEPEPYTFLRIETYIFNVKENRLTYFNKSFKELAYPTYDDIKYHMNHTMEALLEDSDAVF